MKAQLSWLKRLLLDQVFLLIVICIIGLFTPWNQLLKSAEEILLAIREQAQVAPIPTAIGYVLSFIGMTAISFPGPMALLMAVFGGWLFGWYAIPLSSFSSSTGACLAFLSSRYFLSDSTLFRFFPALQRFNQDRSHAPWLVLLSCRLNPLIPYVLENLYFGRTQIPLWQFWIVTIVGMLHVTTLYVMTGAQLAKVDSFQGLISWQIIACFVAISLVPIVALWFFPKKVAVEC